ncbi:LysO family transporter [Peptococcaceae bacterium 1198_IL3148]
MTQVLLAVALGFLVGHFKLLPQNGKLTQRAMTFGLIFLLLVMGAQLGANKQVLADFGAMGLQALMLAVGGIAGSVLLVKLAEGYIRKGLTKNNQRDGVSLLVNKCTKVGESK